MTKGNEIEKVRLDPSITLINGKQALDRQSHFPSYLALLTNATSRGGSKVYLNLFGIGVNDWRILSALIHDPGCCAIDICEAIGIDRAAASRAIVGMEKAGFLRSEPVAGSPRRRALFITDEGQDLHDKILRIVAVRELILLKGFTEEERNSFLSYLKRIMANMDSLEEFEEKLVDREISDEALGI